MNESPFSKELEKRNKQTEREREEAIHRGALAYEKRQTPEAIAAREEAKRKVLKPESEAFPKKDRNKIIEIFGKKSIGKILKNKGWRSESARHALARRGIKTKYGHISSFHEPKQFSVTEPRIRKMVLKLLKEGEPIYNIEKLLILEGINEKDARDIVRREYDYVVRQGVKKTFS